MKISSRLEALTAPMRGAVGEFFHELERSGIREIWVAREVLYQDSLNPEDGYLIGIGCSAKEALSYIRKKKQRKREVLPDGRIVFTVPSSEIASESIRTPQQQIENFQLGYWEVCGGMSYVEKCPLYDLTEEGRKELLRNLLELE